MIKLLGRIGPHVRRSSIAFSYRASGAVVTFLFSVVLARALAVAEFGIVTTMMSIAVAAGTISGLGQQLRLLASIPPLYSAKEFKQISRLTTEGSLIAGVNGLAVATVAYVASALLKQHVEVFQQPSYVYGLALIPLLALIEMQSFVGQSIGSISVALLPKDVTWRLLILLCIGVDWMFAAARPTAGFVLVVAVILLIGIFAIQQQLLSKRIGRQPLFSFSRLPSSRRISQVLTTSFPYWVASIGNTFIYSADTAIVGLFMGPANGALYFAANRFALMLDFFTHASSLVAAPTISRLRAVGDTEQIAQTASQAAAFGFAAALVGFLIYVAFGHWFLHLFGRAYESSYVTLLILSAGQLANAYLGLGPTMLVLLGEARATTRWYLLVVVISSIVLVIVARQGNLVAVAAVSACTLPSVKLLCCIETWRKTRIRMTAAFAMTQFLDFRRAQKPRPPSPNRPKPIPSASAE